MPANDPLHAPMSHEARELELYAENDGGLYKSMLVPIQRALANRMANGTYLPTKGVVAFMHFADAAAQKYAREDSFRGSRTWHDIFPIADRRLVAARFAREFEVEYKLGNYNHLLNETARKRAITAGRLPGGKSPGQIERATLLRRGTSDSNRAGSRLGAYRTSSSPYMRRAHLGDRASCTTCGMDIEFHGSKHGWVGRGGDRFCDGSGSAVPNLPHKLHTPYIR